MSHSRREFLRRITYLGFGAYVVQFADACTPHSKKADEKASDIKVEASLNGALHGLQPHQYLTFAAIAERLLPRDETPGAIDLGVPDYIDRFFAAADVLGIQQNLLTGLGWLDQGCVQKHGKFFINLSAVDQDRVLQGLQHGDSAERRFFENALMLTLEGAFGDPIYGGNKEGQGFALVGFYPSAPLPGQSLIKFPPRFPVSPHSCKDGSGGHCGP